MSQIKTTNEVQVYEVDGTETTGLDRPILYVKNHWNQSSMVVLKYEDVQLTIPHSALEKAMQNAKNAHTF